MEDPPRHELKKNFETELLEPIPGKFQELNELFREYREGDLTVISVEAGPSSRFKRLILRTDIDYFSHLNTLFLDPRVLLTDQSGPVSRMEFQTRMLQLPTQPQFWRDYKQVGRALLGWVESGKKENDVKTDDHLSRLFDGSPYVFSDPDKLIENWVVKMGDCTHTSPMILSDRLESGLFEGKEVQTDDLRIQLFVSSKHLDLDVIDMCRRAVS